MKTPFVHLLLLSFSAPGLAQRVSQTNSVQTAWTPDSLFAEHAPEHGVAAPTVIRFHNGQRFATGLYDVTFLGLLPAAKAPYVVLSGRACTECDANISVYFLSPLGKRATEMTDRYWSPGQETDRETRTVARRSRAFIGSCIAGITNAVVWYDSLALEDGGWASGLSLVRVVADTIAAELRRPAPPMAPTLQLVRAGFCREIPGLDQSSEP